MTNNIIRAIERMNGIIEEMRQLREEFEAIVADTEVVEYEHIEDLDSFENLSEEELEGLLSDEYKEAMLEEMNEELTDEEMTELIENDYYDWENDLDDEDDEEEIEIFKINFDEEEFKLLYELTNDIPYGYVHNTLTNKFIVTVDEDTLYDIKEKLNYEIDRYENMSSMSPEISIIRNYIDWLISLPWNKSTRDNNDINDIRKKLYGCDTVLIESNHDVEMLRRGPYPAQLKLRILSDEGHLSNNACAIELPELLKNGTSRIVLGHISRENNTPLLAERAATTTLASIGAKKDEDYILQTAKPKIVGVTVF